MTVLRIILRDQLSHDLSSLRQMDATQDIIYVCEAMEEATDVPHHPKKLAFIFASMRHFAEELEKKGFRVVYVKLDDPENTGFLEKEILRAISTLKPDQVVLTEPSEYHVLEKIKKIQLDNDVPFHILEDDRFLASKSFFANWAKGKKQLRMEYFYREMRKKYDILMDQNGKPEGGEWNYDKANRKPPKPGLKSPRRISHKKSRILNDVLDLVTQQFPNHFGTLLPFHFAVTRDQALTELDHFLEELLPQFGDFQDAMVIDEPYLYHSLIAAYVNVGLLLPLEICQKAELMYKKGLAPLNAVEGFIRQVLGWREYIRGIYWHHMPEYGRLNSLEAKTPLPDFYWTAQTKMLCMQQAVEQTRDHAYSHHIQRLMVTGNFALLAGLDVRHVQDWYLAVYADAYEWVEMPNTLGMALFGDGGVVASKPYAASGKYINRMSNFCGKCKYDPEEMTGDKACPFNALYWDFLIRNEDSFRGNQRMPFVFSTWDKFSPDKQKAIRSQAAITLKKMNDGVL